jgi:NAD(P)-dependent dehydrogenase (short-subunit alcohol dehydrogenase family)
MTSIDRLVDTALDRSVVGYTRLGYAVRSRGWESPGDQPLAGRVVAITGATSGIGLAAAELLARGGARVILLVRDLERGGRAKAELTARVGGAEVHLYRCDLASLDSVRRCAATLTEELPALDVLVNNAGVLTAQRELSEDGIELCLATNVIGPFLLTAQLVPLLTRSGAGRVITVSSGGMYAARLHLEDLQLEREHFDGVRAYARSKRAEVVLNELWAERLETDGVACHAMHPGWVETPGLSASLPRFRRALRPLLRTPEQGADTIAWLARAASLGTGGFWHDRRRRPTHYLPWTRESAKDRDRLWKECERLSGTTQA